MREKPGRGGRSRGRTLRTAGGVLLAGAALLAALGAGLAGSRPAAAQGPLPTPSPPGLATPSLPGLGTPSLGLPTITPLPTPTLPTLPGLPTPTPTALPSTPSPVSGGTAPSPPGSAQSPPGAPAPSGSVALPAGSLGALFGAFSPAWAAEIAGAFNAPIAAQPPALLPVDLGAPGQPPPPARPALPAAKRTGVAPALAGAGAGGLVLALLVGLLYFPPRRSLLRLRRLLRPLAVVIAAVAGIAMAVPTSALTAPGRTRPVVPRGDLAAIAVRSGSGTPRPAAPARLPASLLPLERVESRVVAARERVVTDQTRVRGLAVGSAAGSARAAALDGTLADLPGAQAAYSTALLAEYRYFVGVVEAPGGPAALAAAVVAAGRPAAMQPLIADLQTVETTLAQEAAIRAASAQPVTIPSLPGLGGDRLVPPVQYSGISQPFGPTPFAAEPPYVYNGVYYPHFHTGIDLVAPEGAPIVAAAPGVVAFAGSSVNGAGKLVGYGNYVVVEHPGGWLTLYAHMSRILARRGETVSAGQLIGLVGMTGNATGPHLHFEVRHDDVPLNPLPYLLGEAVI